MSARVYLIGAGPGDPELLTLKAVRCLGIADVVLIDDLVDRRTLDHVRNDARVIEVGKRGGKPSTPQRVIERLMLRLVRRSLVVARVKGGDPYVFGRGGEEALLLARHGIAYEVVSGISAGIAVPAAAGIPVTHRGMSRGVTFISGQTADDEEPDWCALAKSGTTLAIFMGLARLPRIAARLLASGLSPRTPAVLIERGTLPDQRVLHATLATLAARAAAAGVEGPSMIVIGEVASLAEQLGPSIEGSATLQRAA
ncbi:MAG: uroporphyrinogen-III C-methyltransferase [Pseudomonadota bacterium]|nr:uroporphyrinogen-III C-methyltransferase [Pseudomonadota bacterium]